MADPLAFITAGGGAIASILGAWLSQKARIDKLEAECAAARADNAALRGTIATDRAQAIATIRDLTVKIEGVEREAREAVSAAEQKAREGDDRRASVMIGFGERLAVACSKIEERDALHPTAPRQRGRSNPHG